MENPIVVLITASSEDEAASIGQKLVDEKLAACANLIPRVRSIFAWRGKVCNEKEILLFVKSRENLLDRIVTRVRELHSYEIPEVIALPIIGGSEDYLKWVEGSLF